MAKIRIVGDSSGYVELAAPNAAGNNTLELPSNATKLVGADTNNNVNLSGIITATTFSGRVSTTGISTFSSGINVGTGASISSPATNVLALGTNNVERIRVGAAGSIGIGTADPQARLHLCAPNGFDAFLMLDDVNRNAVIYAPGSSSGEFYFRKGSPASYSDRLIIDSSGNLKLGTAGTKVLNSSGNPILQQTGSVLQVVHTDFTTSGTITASSDTNISGFSASITPSSTSSKILAIVHFTGLLDCDGRLKLKRNTTIVRDNLLGSDRSGGSTAGWSYYDSYTVCASYLDSPGLTSSITYQISAEATGCGSNVYYNRDPSNSNNNGRSGITLLEIAG